MFDILIGKCQTLPVYDNSSTAITSCIHKQKSILWCCMAMYFDPFLQTINIADYIYSVILRSTYVMEVQNVVPESNI